MGSQRVHYDRVTEIIQGRIYNEKKERYISIDGDYICQLYIYILLVFISTFSPFRLIISCISHMCICSGMPALQESMLLTMRFNGNEYSPFEYENDVGDNF